MSGSCQSCASRLLAAGGRACAPAFALVLIALGGCGGSLLKQASAPSIELQSTPVATYDVNSGKTTVVLDFIIRDGQGQSVDPNAVALRRLIDSQPQDAESIANFQDAQLASNLRLGLVLDASYSMLTWTPPAFAPMKSAALETLDSVRQQFASRNAGAFTSYLLWFQDQYLCLPSSTAMPDRAVLDIPEPKAGSSTKLYAAAAAMVDELKAAYDAASPAPSASDHFAMVLFTDGIDNYSSFDSSHATPVSYPASGGSFSCSGVGPMTRNDLLSKLKAFPQLKVHVIGLGNEINSADLGAIASQGNGRFVSNPDSGKVSSLFEEIQREFTTVRRDGITTPIPVGDHEYVEEVSVGGAITRVRFNFRVTATGATVLTNTLVVG